MRIALTGTGDKLVISAMGQRNSITLSSYLLVGDRAIPCVSLVDSGCTGLAFLDFKFAVRHHISLTKLRERKPLSLADGALSSWIEWKAEVCLAIGDHREQLQFYITTLAEDNPVILGLPWLSKHNPAVDWKNLRLTFGEDCRGRCLPPQSAGLAAPRVPTTPKTQFHARVEDAEDEGEPEEREEVNKLSAKQRAARSRRRRDWRHRQQLSQHREAAVARGGPRWTMAPPHARARVIPDQLPRIPQQARRAAGRRVSPAQQRRAPLAPTASRRAERIDGRNIKLLNAPNFALFCRQKGVSVMRTTFGELEEAMQAAIPDVHLPDLPDYFFKDLLCRKGSAKDYKEQLPDDLHDFIDEVWEDGPTIQRITEEDARKFFDKSDKPSLTATEIKVRLPPEYRDLFEAFLPQEADTLPPHRSYDHKIELVPGSKLPFSRNRPLSPMELRVVKRWLDDNLVKGFIRPSKSSSASPLLLAQKPGGGVRICVDYRGVNNISMKSRYPIPLIKETLDSICKARIFTKLDVIAAFNRVRVAEGHEWLTAFITRFGLYESLVTPFGLQGAPATFQHYINDILYDLLDDCATAYLDDILIYSTGKEDHVKQVREVLRRLIDAGLQIDIEKCEFHTTKTKYLGLIITPGGIEMDPEKVSAIASWLPPTTRRQLQRFLGFANFYRRFIKDFSGVARPLYDLTKKTVDWNWTSRCQAAFEQLKHCFASAPALRIYDWEKPAIVETDASDWSAGGTLLQEDDDGELHPVAYFSAKHLLEMD
jgi:hypothetical protein